MSHARIFYFGNLVKEGLITEQWVIKAINVNLELSKLETFYHLKIKDLFSYNYKHLLIFLFQKCKDKGQNVKSKFGNILSLKIKDLFSYNYKHLFIFLFSKCKDKGQNVKSSSFFYSLSVSLVYIVWVYKMSMSYKRIHIYIYIFV